MVYKPILPDHHRVSHNCTRSSSFNGLVLEIIMLRKEDPFEDEEEDEHEDEDEEDPLEDDLHDGVADKLLKLVPIYSTTGVLCTKT